MKQKHDFVVISGQVLSTRVHFTIDNYLIKHLREDTSIYKTVSSICLKFQKALSGWFDPDFKDCFCGIHECCPERESCPIFLFIQKNLPPKFLNFNGLYDSNTNNPS